MQAPDQFLRKTYEAFHDHATFCRESLRIRDKHGVTVPFQLQPAQKRLHEIIMEIRAKGRPVRIISLKARQVMISTGTAGEFFHEVPFTAGQKARVVAHNDDTAHLLFDYYHQFHENYQPFRGIIDLPECVKDAEDKGFLEYANGSRFQIQTARNLEKGRGGSFRFLHLSEFAFWPNPKKLMTGLMQTVPDDPDTMVIIESTANGVGGEFHRLWLEANDPSSESEWVPFFFAWWQHPEYTLDLAAPAAFQQTLAQDEIELRQRYNLTLGQLAWRRWAIKNKCQNSPEVFKQEYPSNPEEAFLFSGRPRFSHQHLKRMPIDEAGGTVGELIEQQNGPKLVLSFLPDPDRRGALTLYKKPSPTKQYVIGVDVAEGIDASETLGAPDPDYSVAQVLDQATGEQCAKLRGRIEPAAFAEYTNALARYYNWAYIVPEANGPGIAFLEQLLRDNYPPALIYHRKPHPDELFANNDSTLLSKIGWKTTTVTRQQLISRHDQAIREYSVIIRDPHTLSEHQTFVIKPNSKAEATDGCHDDEVFALALAVIGLEAAPADRALRAVKELKPPAAARSGTVASYGKRRQEGRGMRVKL